MLIFRYSFIRANLHHPDKDKSKDKKEGKKDGEDDAEKEPDCSFFIWVVLTTEYYINRTKFTYLINLVVGAY